MGGVAWAIRPARVDQPLDACEGFTHVLLKCRRQSERAMVPRRGLPSGAGVSENSTNGYNRAPVRGSRDTRQVFCQRLARLRFRDLALAHDEQSPTRLQEWSPPRLGAYSVAAGHHYALVLPMLARFSRSGIAP